jgi:hypothetical protein
MSQPNNQVFIGFGLEVAGLGDFFTLNDPVKGQLDNTNFTLANSEVLVDISEDVRSIRTRRGRSRELEKFNAGSIDILLSNANRKYDPTNARTTQSSVNLSTNPSFELDIAGIATTATAFSAAGATVARITSEAQYGLASLEVTTDQLISNQGAHATETLDPNTTYTVSAFVKAISGSTVSMRTRDITNSLNGTLSGPAVVGNGFQRLTSTITTGATTPSVQIVFFEDFSAGNFFTLDDNLKGLLDDPTYTLAPNSAVQSVFAVDAILIEAGTSLNAYYDGGTADLSYLLPETAWQGTPGNSSSTITFSIPNTGSPFFPEIVPRKQVRFTSNGQEVFDGIIDDWNFSYEILGDATAQVIGTDAFAVLSLTNIVPYSAPQQLTGERIDAILSRPEVNWPVAKRQIASGNATVAAQDIGGTGAQARAVPTLNYLQQVELAEAGALFINKDGAVEFDARTGAQGLPSVMFSDDGAGIPFTDIKIEYGTEEMKNRISVYRDGSNTQVTAENLNSINRFGPFDYEVTNSLLATDEVAEEFALYVLAKYGEPALRIDSISVVLNELGNSQLADMLNLELSDPVQVKFTPERVGAPIEQVLVIDSIEHSVSPVDHVVTLNFSQSAIGFILDDAQYGLLDVSELGF